MGLEDKKQPFNREYRRIVKLHKESLPKYRLPFIAHDSLLQDKTEAQDTFEESFLNVLPEGQKDLCGYIERTLYLKKGKAIGIEFGGPGSRLFTGFSRGFFRKTAGIDIIGRHGTSNPVLRLGVAIKDTARNHKVMTGDILAPKTYNVLREWLGGNKPDLIIERMRGGFEENVYSKTVLFKTLERWYGFLNQEGLMFIQVPRIAHASFKEWVDMVQGQNYKNLLEVSYFFPRQGADSSAQHLSAMRLRKLPGAPKRLPQLEILRPERSPEQ